MKFIHARITPTGILYRVWTTVSDCYLCEPMTLREMFDRFGDDLSATGMERAREHGMSTWRHGDPNTLRDPWCTELDGYGDPREAEPDK